MTTPNCNKALKGQGAVGQKNLPGRGFPEKSGDGPLAKCKVALGVADWWTGP